MIQLTVDELNDAYSIVHEKAKHTAKDITTEIAVSVSDITESLLLTPQTLWFKFFPDLKQGEGAWVLTTEVEVTDLEEA